MGPGANPVARTRRSLLLQCVLFLFSYPAAPAAHRYYYYYYSILVPHERRTYIHKLIQVGLELTKVALIKRLLPLFRRASAPSVITQAAHIHSLRSPLRVYVINLYVPNGSEISAEI